MMKKKGLSVRKPTSLDMKEAEQLAFSAMTNGANLMSLSARQHEQEKRQKSPHSQPQPQPQLKESRQPSQQQRRRQAQKEKEEEDILPEFPSELMFTTLSDDLLFDVDESDDEEEDDDEQDGDTDENPREQQNEQEHRICLIPLDGRVISVEDHSRSSNMKTKKQQWKKPQLDASEEVEAAKQQLLPYQQRLEQRRQQKRLTPKKEAVGKQPQQQPSQQREKDGRPTLTRQDEETSWRNSPSMLSKQKAVRNGLISNHLTDVTPEEFLDNFVESSEKFLSTAYM